MNYEKEIVFAYLEEDNIQRAYFRIKPLLTVSGDAQAEAAKLWPNEGALRIVPDKNEQFYFKDRMRTLGSYCIMDLTPFPADANKIRTNKNYRPEREEQNQFILYSDAVKALPEDGFYDVVTGAAKDVAVLAASAVTPCFFINEGGQLYGPIHKTRPELPTLATLPEGASHTIMCPDGQTRTIFCAGKPAAHEVVPPAVLRQPVAASPAPVTRPNAAMPVPPVAVRQPVAVSPAPVARSSAAVASVAVPKPVAAAVPKSDAGELPIGKPLTILDSAKDFKETLQDIAQPLSSGANLLRNKPPAEQANSIPTPVLSGTPLYRGAVPRTAMPRPKNQLQEVVANQWRAARNEPPANPLPDGAAFRPVENPVENACQSLKHAWQMPETQGQLVDFILSLTDMHAQLERRLSSGTEHTILQKVLLNRLQDMEADRLAALVQLDKAKSDVDAFRRTVIGEARGEQQAELARLSASKAAHEASLVSLKQQLTALESQRNALTEQIDQLSGNVLPEVLAKALAQAQMVAPVSGLPLRLNASTGQMADVEAMIEGVMTACRLDGVVCGRNGAVAILALLAVCPRIGLVTTTPAPTVTLLEHLVRRFGWEEGFACQISAEQTPLVSPLPADRAPLLLVTTLPSYTPIAHVTKLLLGRSVALLTRNAAYEMDQWPILSIPALPTIDALPDEAHLPVISASSLAALPEKTAVSREDSLAVMKPLMACVAPLSGQACAEMTAFIAACAGWMEHGLADACDWAAMLWLIPMVERTPKAVAAIKPLLEEYPRALAALQA